MQVEEVEGNDKRGESLPLSSDPTNNDNNKDKNAQSALTNAETMTIRVCCPSRETVWGTVGTTPPNIS